MKKTGTRAGHVVPPPSTPKLSDRSRTLWVTLHDEYEFEPHTDELLERALTYFDLADTLRERAHEAGLTTPSGRGALAGSRDASMAGLKLMQAVGLDKVDAEKRRPGRPSDRAWSAIRGGRETA